MSVQDFPAISTETVFEKKSVPRQSLKIHDRDTKTTEGSPLAEGNLVA